MKCDLEIYYYEKDKSCNKIARPGDIVRKIRYIIDRKTGMFSNDSLFKVISVINSLKIVSIEAYGPDAINEIDSEHKYFVRYLSLVKRSTIHCNSEQISMFVL